ncbi:MAG: hypothetical protein OMM_12009 [Candidatus Magnetoglobus multicellularis str. Araruama]|uniref:AMP-dependent synthetase/ligase domain-containing protein n=1 Tax=Candidatus Magnetoglobus multicellularis str. Araruama TaxID=890399 RepID=A0A1V1NWT7_9BACT|nr:MAG: hypothetical protein OMM_12009 [Candidatus Magnetoglobus multicellularis str. Araruama]
MLSDCFFQYQDIKRFKDRLLVLLADICLSPEKQLRQFNCLPQWERDLLCIQWNQTQKPLNDQRCIHQMIDQQAQEHPHETAVVYENTCINFQELKDLTDNIAWKLQHMGVQAQSCVGLFTERSLEMIVGIESILKAGGAYVPIDIHASSNRIAHMINDAGLKLVLTMSRLIPLLSEHNVLTVCLDHIDLKTNDPCCIPRPMSIPNHLAYIMYTSGSTGHPNGVMIEQAALTHLYWGLYETIYSSFNQSCRIALNGPISFDTSVKQIIQIAGGHCLVIIPENVRSHPIKLNHLVKGFKVSAG